MTDIERFAKDYRLKVRLDECGDAIIPGRRGQLHFDRGELCLMMLDARPVKTSRLDSLIGPGGSVWQGDKSPNADGRRVQDVEIRGIAPAKYREAIRIAGVKLRRVLSEAQKASLERARAASPLFWSRAPDASLALETIPGAGVISGGHLARLICRYRLDYAAFDAICKAARNLEWPGVRQRLLR